MSMPIGSDLACPIITGRKTCETRSELGKKTRSSVGLPQLPRYLDVIENKARQRGLAERCLARRRLFVVEIKSRLQITAFSSDPLRIEQIIEDFTFNYFQGHSRRFAI
jgi:hypothetical protein